MPNKDWHLAKKDHNLDTSAYLWAGIDYLDWEVTTLFYSAVHFVDSYLATRGQHPENHLIRNGMVRRFLSAIEVEYMCLYRLSKGARYGPQSIAQDDVDDAEDWFDAVKFTLAPLV